MSGHIRKVKHPEYIVSLDLGGEKKVIESLDSYLGRMTALLVNEECFAGQQLSL